MKITTLLNAYRIAILLNTMSNDSRHHYKYLRQIPAFRDGIYRRFIRLEQEVQRLEEHADFWKSEALELEREE